MNETNPPDGSNSSNWLSVADVAARLGVSPRAVQKRCALGKMAARRVSTAGGVRWQVAANELREPANEQDANQTNLGHEPANQNGSFGSRLGSFGAQNGANLDANQRTEGREPANQTNELRELLASEREFSAFLKSQLEDANRNAAELRAALRKALEIAPRQLAPSSENLLQSSGATQTARESSATEPRAPSGDGDELSEGELLELCGRICAR